MSQKSAFLVYNPDDEFSYAADSPHVVAAVLIHLREIGIDTGMVQTTNNGAEHDIPGDAWMQTYDSLKSWLMDAPRPEAVPDRRHPTRQQIAVSNDAIIHAERLDEDARRSEVQ